MVVAKKKQGNGKYQDWITEDGLLKIEAWARDGLTNEQIANNIGIAEGTLYTWINKYDELNEALKKGKEVIDIQVENALLKRALGYRYKEITRNLVADEDCNTRMEVTKEVEKEVLPDTTAQIFWLKNRRPDIWRDRKEQQITGELDTRPLKEVQSDDLQKIIDKLGD